MKKVLVLFLAICMVFALGGTILAAELEPEEIETKEYVRDFVADYYSGYWRCAEDIPAEFTITFRAAEGDCDEWPGTSQVYLDWRDMNLWDGEENCTYYSFYDSSCDGRDEAFRVKIENEYRKWVESIAIEDPNAELLWYNKECDVCKDQYNRGWFHPMDKVFEPGLDTKPSFDDVVDGDAKFAVRDRWYNWDVETCDECLPGDVVLWEVCNPCPCNLSVDDPCIPCGEVAGLQTSRRCPPQVDHCAQWVTPQFFEMDLCNCNNISQIDLEIMIDCAAGCDVEDRLYGMWQYNGGDECSDCSWEAVSFEYDTTCTQDPCEVEECECSINASFSGDCGDDSCEPCTEGELCDLDGALFGVGYVLPVVNDAYFFENELFWEVKTWPCNPCDCGEVGFELMEMANAPAVSGDVDVFFGLAGLEPDDPEACKLQVSVFSKEECPEGLGVFLENGDYWVQVPGVTVEETDFDGFACKVSFSFMKSDLPALGFEGFQDLVGLAWSAGDPADFPTGPAPDPGNGNGDDNETEPTPSTTASSDSGSGCSVGGFPAAILLLIAPIAVLLRKRF